MIRTRLEGEENFLKKNQAVRAARPASGRPRLAEQHQQVDRAGKDLLVICRDQVQMALGASIPFARSSCGYVGASDGWTDHQATILEMDWEFGSARDGNVAVMAELTYPFPRRIHAGLRLRLPPARGALSALQSLGQPFETSGAIPRPMASRLRRRSAPSRKTRETAGRLYRLSHSLLLAHEDKTYPGAMIAAMSIPWGESAATRRVGGYHLVWTRECAERRRLLACGNKRRP